MVGIDTLKVSTITQAIGPSIEDRIVKHAVRSVLAVLTVKTRSKKT